MRLHLILILSIIYVSAITAKNYSKEISEEISSIIEEPDPEFTSFLLSSARIRSGLGVGSASIIYSKNIDGKASTFFLTNYHVVKNANRINVETFDYNSHKKIIGTYKVEATIIIKDEELDLALLKSNNNKLIYKYVADLFPENNHDELSIMDSVCVIGSALGKNPTITTGIINNFNGSIQKHQMWTTTAEIIYGNSGGGVFKWSEKRSRYEFIGVPTYVPSVGGIPITHMGAFIPYEEVYKFLKENGYGFIVREQR